MPSIKIVIGETASKLHSDGQSDLMVARHGKIKTIEYETEAEVRAYIDALEQMDNYTGFCIYNPDNLPEHITEPEDILQAVDAYLEGCGQTYEKEIRSIDEVDLSELEEIDFHVPKVKDVLWKCPEACEADGLDIHEQIVIPFDSARVVVVNFTSPEPDSSPQCGPS